LVQPEYSRVSPADDQMAFRKQLRPAPSTLHTPSRPTTGDLGMRYSSAFGFLSVLLANLAGGCTPYIPVVDTFTTSALNPVGNIPPEFVEFNNYDPEVNALLADQICATPHIPLQEKSLRASPGELIGETGRCRPYVVNIHNIEEVFLP
jgi:hypothetical protein